MKIFREVHDFIAGGSWIAPAGVAVALAIGAVSAGLSAPIRAALVFGMLAVTFVASVFEQPG